MCVWDMRTLQHFLSCIMMLSMLGTLPPEQPLVRKAVFCMGERG
jgi:hypothetical protein